MSLNSRGATHPNAPCGLSWLYTFFHAATFRRRFDVGQRNPYLQVPRQTIPRVNPAHANLVSTSSAKQLPRLHIEHAQQPKLPPALSQSCTESAAPIPGSAHSPPVAQNLRSATVFVSFV